MKNNLQRKSAIAKIAIKLGNGKIIINEKDLEGYMQNNPKSELH